MRAVTRTAFAAALVSGAAVFAWPAQAWQCLEPDYVGERRDPERAVAEMTRHVRKLMRPMSHLLRRLADRQHRRVILAGIADINPLPREAVTVGGSRDIIIDSMEEGMGDLLIRDVDDNVIRTLKSKAEVNGTSLQQEAKKALTKGAPLTGEERGRLLQEYLAEGPVPKLSVSTADIIRDMREEES